MFRLVYSTDGHWKAYTVYTNLQSLNDYPEKVGALRNPLPNHGKWAEQRQKEIEFEGVDPYVVVVGAGQSGLDLGARLKFLDIPTLIIEKYPRVGDRWRNRYQALCLHDPVCKLYSFGECSTRNDDVCRDRPHGLPPVCILWLRLAFSHRPFFRFPANWPVWTPAQKVHETTSKGWNPFSVPFNSWLIGLNPMPQPWSSMFGPLRP